MIITQVPVDLSNYFKEHVAGEGGMPGAGTIYSVSHDAVGYVNANITGEVNEHEPVRHDSAGRQIEADGDKEKEISVGNSSIFINVPVVVKSREEAESWLRQHFKELTGPATYLEISDTKERYKITHDAYAMNRLKGAYKACRTNLQYAQQDFSLMAGLRQYMAIARDANDAELMRSYIEGVQAKLQMMSTDFLAGDKQVKNHLDVAEALCQHALAQLDDRINRNVIGKHDESEIGAMLLLSTEITLLEDGICQHYAQCQEDKELTEEMYRLAKAAGGALPVGTTAFACRPCTAESTAESAQALAYILNGEYNSHIVA